MIPTANLELSGRHRGDRRPGAWHNAAALDVLLALALIGLALFVGALVLRRAPTGVLVFGAVVVAFGLGIPALVIDDNTTEKSGGGGEAAVSPESGGGDQAPEEASAQTGGGGGGGGAAASAEGKQIFTQSCGTCHTLSDAGTSGSIGPNLDDLKPDKARVTSAIENGGAGTGAMPANIVTGQEAEAVADYVSSVAGK
jgi:mono/diheme cytochrome c family protein